MNGDWSLIFRGFFVAALGTTSTILYIVAISAAFVGRFASAGAAAVGGVVLAVAFLRLVGSYLDAIDRRAARETARLTAPNASQEASVTDSGEKR